MIPGPKPPVSKQDQTYSAPRTAAPLSGAGPYPVANTSSYANTVIVPGGATNGPSKGQ